MEPLVAGSAIGDWFTAPLLTLPNFAAVTNAYVGMRWVQLRICATNPCDPKMSTNRASSRHVLRTRHGSTSARTVASGTW